MRFIMNALDEDQIVQAAGKHFSFKGRQIKPFQSEDIAKFILSAKQDMGFVEIPVSNVGDDTAVETYDTSPAGAALIEAKRKEGVENYCNKLRRVLYNQQVSLKQDLAKVNNNSDPMHLASDTLISQMEHLVKYQSKKEDASQIRLDKAKKLEKLIEKSGS